MEKCNIDIKAIKSKLGVTFLRMKKGLLSDSEGKDLLQKDLIYFKEQYKDTEDYSQIKSLFKQAAVIKGFWGNLSKCFDESLLDLILNSTSEDVQVIDTKSTDANKLTSPEIAKNALLVLRNFLLNAYGHATRVKEACEREHTVKAVNAIIVDRIKGELVTPENVNSKIKEYQLELFNDVIEYLKLYRHAGYAGKAYTLGSLDLYSKVYDSFGEYTGNIYAIKKILEEVDLLNPKNINPDTLILYFEHPKDDLERATLKAYNSWIILNNFDSFLSDKFGKSLVIKPKEFNKFTGSTDKYTIAEKGANVNKTWRTTDDIVVSSEVDNIVKLLVNTTRKYNWLGLTPLNDTYLNFGDLEYITCKIKNLVLNEDIGNINFTNFEVRVENDLLIWDLFSEDTKSAIKGKNLRQVINMTRLNPQKYLSAIFELFSNKSFYNYLEKNTSIVSGFTNSEKSILYSLNKEIFSTKENSLHTINLQNLDVNYYGYITQVVDSIYEVKFLQYYQDEDGNFRTRSLKDSALDDIQRDIENLINTSLSNINSQEYELNKQKYRIKIVNKFGKEVIPEFIEVKNNDGSTKTELNATQIRFIIPGSGSNLFETEVRVSIKDGKVVIKNGNKVLNEYEKYDLLVPIIKDVLKLNINNEATKAALLSVFSDSYGVLNSSLTNFLGRTLMCLTLSNTILKDKSFKELKTLRNVIFGENAPKLNGQLNELALIHKSDRDTLFKIAQSQAIANGSITNTQVKGAEGNTFSGSTLSRLLGSHLNQFEIQGRKPNSVVKDCSLLNIPGLYKGVYTAKEVKTLFSSKEHTKWTVSEFATSSLLYDFLGGFKTKIIGKEIFHDGIIGFIPSVNSDKNTINRILIDTNKEVEFIDDKGILQRKPLCRLKNTELTSFIKKEMGSIYLKMYNNIQNDMYTAFTEVFTPELLQSVLAVNPKFNIELLKDDYLFGFKNYNEALNSVGLNPSEELSKAIIRYNSVPGHNLVLTDLIHYSSNKKGNIESNMSLLSNLYRFNPSVSNFVKNSSEISEIRNLFELSFSNELEFWSLKNSEVIKSLLDNDFVLDASSDLFKEYFEAFTAKTIGNSDAARLNTITSTYNKQWVNSSGNLILAKVTINNKKYSILNKLDLLKLEKLLGVSSLIDDINTLTKYNLELNPIIDKYNKLDYVFTLEYMISTVGSHVNHPAKGFKGEFYDKKSTNEEEAARFNALHKRNVSHTAAMQEFQLNLLQGIPSDYNIAIIDDIKDTLFNVSGNEDDSIKPFDGATFVNPFIVYLENFSLGGSKAGITKKLFVHFWDEHTGSGGIIKTAGFGITNDWLRNSPFLQRMMRKMTRRNWKDLLGNDYVTNILKDYSGNTIVYGDLYELVRGKRYKISLEATDLPNVYVKSYTRVSEHGDVLSETVQKEDFIEPEHILISNNYSLWLAFGGMMSMSMVNGKLQLSNKSIEDVVKAMNNVGIVRENAVSVETLFDIYQPLKHSDIHYIPTAGAVKQGAANTNRKSTYYSDEDLAEVDSSQALNSYKIHMLQAGILLDKEHHADEAELSLMTLVISSCASRGYTPDLALNLYNALQVSTSLGIKDLLGTFELYFKAPNDDIKFEKAIVNVLINSLIRNGVDENNSVSMIAKDLIEKALKGIELKTNDTHGVIPFSDNKVFSKLISTISVFLTKSGIKLKVPGILSVLTPSFETTKLYAGKKYEEILKLEDPQVYLEELLEDMPDVYTFDAIGNKSYFNFGELRIQRKYITTKLAQDELGNEIEVQEIVSVDTPKQRKAFKERILSKEFTRVLEYIKEGRNLGAYNVVFNEQYSLYDLNSIQDLYELADYKDLSLEELINFLNNKNIQLDESILSELGAVEQKLQNDSLISQDPQYLDYLLGEFNKKAHSILFKECYKQLQRRVQDDLFALSPKASKEGKTSVLIDKDLIEVDKSTLKIEPYEVIIPKVFATKFGLSEFDSLEEIENNPEYFSNKLLRTYNQNIILDENNYDFELKLASGNSVFIIDSNESINQTNGLVLDPNMATLEENGKIFLVDLNNDVILELANRNDKVYLDNNGNRIIATKNIKHYLDTVDYYSVKLSSKLSIKTAASTVQALKKSKNLIAKKYYDIFAINLIGENINPNAIYLEALLFLSTSQYYDNPIAQSIKELGHEIHTSFLKSLDVVAARIPAQSMLSFMPMKVVAFDNPDINTAYVSTALIWLQGSDYDVDAVSIATFDINNNGILDIHSPYADLSDIDSLKKSLDLPFPTGKKLSLEKTLDIPTLENFYKLLMPVIVNLNGTNYIDTTNLNLIKQLITFTNNHTFYIPDSPVSKQAVKDFLVASGMNNGEDAYILIEQTLKNILLTVNDHNTYLQHCGESKKQRIINNYTMYSMYSIIDDPINLILAQTSVDGTTGPFKKRAKLSPITEVLKTNSPGNFVNKAQAIVENHTGKDCIAVAATGLKGFFALTQYNNGVLNYGTAEELQRLVFNVNIRGKDYHMLSNIRAKDLKSVAPQIREYLNRVDLDYDAATALSALLSLATDNAKELALAKLNAGTKAIGMYIYGLSIGMEFNDIADILTSKIGTTIINMMDGNSFTDNLGMFKISLVFNYFQNGPLNILKQYSFKKRGSDGKDLTSVPMALYLVNELVNRGFLETTDKKASYKDVCSEFGTIITRMLNNNVNFLNILNSMRTSLTNASGKAMPFRLSGEASIEWNRFLDKLQEYAENYYIYKDPIQQDNFLDLLELALGADEMKILGSILKLNQGLPTKVDEILTTIDTIEEVINSRLNMRSACYGDEVPDLDERFSLQEFVLNEEYRQILIDKYDTYKHTFNILDCVTHVPHFWGYLQCLAILDGAGNRATSKYKAIRDVSKDLIKDQKATSKKDKLLIYKGVLNFVSDWLRLTWMRSELLSIYIPAVKNINEDGSIENNYQYTESGELVPIESDTVIQLGTDWGDATFKRYMEKVIIPSLQEKLPTNKFILDITSNIITNTVSHNAAIVYTLPINMMPKTDNDRSVFNSYKAEFNKLKSNFPWSDSRIPNDIKEAAKTDTILEKQINHNIIDLFNYYNLIAFLGKSGLKSLNGIFENCEDYNSLDRFHKFVANFDEYDSIKEGLDFSISELAKWIAPISNPKRLKYSYIYAKDLDLNTTKLMYLTEEEVSDTKASLDPDDYIDNYQTEEDFDYSDYDEESMLTFNKKATKKVYRLLDSNEINFNDFIKGNITKNGEILNEYSDSLKYNKVNPETGDVITESANYTINKVGRKVLKVKCNDIEITLEEDIIKKFMTNYNSNLEGFISNNVIRSILKYKLENPCGK